ncbi:XRE family transcriptional regulator [Streptococcus cuniculi]|uniref:XRE family transcriptional regulator n=1 Tax=Streptococcus cuniculi TaxID=1432788 RepID=A0A4Y9JBA7_9STRE|nr:XRE family transcriptional regulator [Streptococcus cuniculi]MBF0778822.1 XRE family transcriptional regulator [Streptococcus cuniculi]TFU97204.1 XRE family transcriptional regulator [Streptococcus cuniculi]
MIEVLSQEEISNLLVTQSRYQISKCTGISEQTLSNYANGLTRIERMSYENVLKLTEYVKEIIE